MGRSPDGLRRRLARKTPTSLRSCSIRFDQPRSLGRRWNSKTATMGVPGSRSDTMSASLRALLDQSIDYAGLFPPAKLPLDEALRNYARYRKETESWMLSHFVSPVERLAELAEF